MSTKDAKLSMSEIEAEVTKATEKLGKKLLKAVKAAKPANKKELKVAIEIASADLNK